MILSLMSLELQYERQSSLARRLFRMSHSSPVAYHCIMAFLVGVLAWPIVPISLGIEPGGVSLLGTLTGIFVTIVLFAIFLCWTVIFLPIGLLIL